LSIKKKEGVSWYGRKHRLHALEVSFWLARNIQRA
jgi:hypothetical protein